MNCTYAVNTCDGLIAGDPEKEIDKVGTCFRLTAGVIEAARKKGIGMMITHEPTFSHGDSREAAADIDRRKWAMLDTTGLVVYRFHDNAHNHEPDYIHEGFIRAVGLDIAERHVRESLGVCRYSLTGTVTVRSLAKAIEEKLGAQFVRVVGSPDNVVHTVCLALGSVGFGQVNCLFEPGCDLFITGETDELSCCEYVRDADFFGFGKSLLLLGHCSSEYMGMRLLAEDISCKLLPAEYIHCNEVYVRT